MRTQPSAWQGPFLYSDVLVSADGRFLLASSPATNEILAFAIDGTSVGTLQPADGDALERPSSMALGADGRVLAINFDAARVSSLAPPGP